MAGTLPTVRSGAVALYPITRRLEYSTNVAQFINGSEQRFKRRTPLSRFQLSYTDIAAADKNAIAAFHNSQKGAFDSSWTFVFDGITYDNNTFEDDDLVITERAGWPDLYNIPLRFRQCENRAFATPAGVVYPTMANGLLYQLPVETTHRFVTSKVDMDSGKRFAWAWYGSGLTNFPTGPLLHWRIVYSVLGDDDLLTLETFFQAMNGRLGSFEFTDPTDGLVHPKCRFDMDAFEVSYSQVNHAAVTVEIVETF